MMRASFLRPSALLFLAAALIALAAAYVPAAHAQEPGDRDTSKELNLVSANNNSTGAWSDGVTMYVVDDNDDAAKIFAYRLSDFSRDSHKDIALGYHSTPNPAGIWSDGVTMWVSDGAEAKVFAYRMSDKSRDTSRDFDLDALFGGANDSPHAIWSDGATMWVTDVSDNKIYAYRMSDKSRDSARDYALVADNGNANGLWSDGATMWVLDFADAKLYAYHAHPPADGALDASFSGDGKVTTDVTAGNDPGQAVAVQSDGKVLVAGFGTPTGGSQDFTLVRYNADGTPDSGFGTSGQVTTDFDSGADAAFGVAVQSDGKIVVAGFATVTGSGKDFALARYNDDGTLDDTFGTVVSGSTRSGKVTTPIASGTGAEEAFAVAVHSDGKIVAAGYSVANFAVVRYNANGTLDTSFSSDGKVTSAPGASGNVARGVAVLSDGKIVAAGHHHVSGGDYNFAVARYTAAGALDNTFGQESGGTRTGQVSTDLGSTVADYGRAMALQSDGKIVVAGYTHVSGSAVFALVRYDTAGDVDTTFGTSGIQTTDISAGPDEGYAVAIQSDDKIIAAGRAGQDFALVRYGADGAPDGAFGTDGKVTTFMSSNLDIALGVEVQSDGKIVAAGQAGNLFAVARYHGQAAQVTTHWSATLTVQNLGGGTGGCTHTGSTACSVNSVLSDNDFSYGGADYEITRIFVGNDGILYLTLNKAIPSSLKTSALTLNVDGAPFALADATLGQFSVANDELTWASTGLSWTAGNTVSLSLTEGTTQSSDATLSNLTGTPCTSSTTCTGTLSLSPAFNAGTITYTATVANSVTHAKLTPTASHGAATIRVGKGATTMPVNSGSASHAIALEVGLNILGATVTAEDGVTIKVYFVSITRAGTGQSSDATLSDLTGTPCTDTTTCTGTLSLSPAFNAATISYTATVANSVTHAKLTPTASHSAATIRVGTEATTMPVNSGSASRAIALEVGLNLLGATVTAEDGVTIKVYFVSITRAGAAQSADATLSNLTGTPCTDSTTCSGTLSLSPAFDLAVTSYRATAANTATHARLTPTARHGAATIQVGKGNSLAPVNSGAASTAIALDVGENAITVRVTAGNGITIKDYTVTITRLAVPVEDWSPTFKVRKLGPGNNYWVGCRKQVADARCDSEGVLSNNEFSYTQITYGKPYTWTIRVEELYRTSKGSTNELVLVADVIGHLSSGPLPHQPFMHTFNNFVLTVLDPRNGNTTPERFPLDRATIEGRGNVARWTYEGTPWSPYPQYQAVSTTVTLGMEPPRATLDTIMIYYDGDPPVDGFIHHAIATPAAYGYRSRIPGEFPSIDPDKGVVQTTHAKLRVHPAHPGSTLRVGKVTYPGADQSDPQATPPVVCTQRTGLLTGEMPVTYWRCVALEAIAVGDQSHAIELNAHIPNTFVDIEVTDGGVVSTYLLNIDPPPRTYRLSPQAMVVEGQEALLTLSLSQPAPAGGLEFTVSAGYGSAGPDDVGVIPSPVTVPEGSTSLEIAVPTVDDNRDEENESFTVTVAAVRAGWAVAPLATGTATVTIEDNDDAHEYADLIARVKEWRDDPCCAHHKPHTDRWDRVLLTFGETVADTSLEPMTAAEAQTYADRGWTRWVEVAEALREQESRNSAPTVSTALADAVIVNESGTRTFSLSGVFSDADNDSLSATTASSDQTVATALAATDHSTLTVTAQGRGEAEITVTANDGKGGMVSDAFTVTVKAAPVVGSAISDLSLEVDATQDVSLAGVFSDADGDALTITAASSDGNTAAVILAADQSQLTVAGIAGGTATITVTAQDADGNAVSDAFDVSVVKAPEQQDPPPQETPNRAPTVAAAIADATIVNESGTRTVSLDGIFSDADSDALTITAATSDSSKATVSVASDYSTLTVTAQGRGEATITVTANDGNGGTVSDTFTVTVKAAPVVASAISDVSGLEVDATQDVSLAGVFSDADNDALTITAASSDDAKATVTVAADRSRLTVAGVAEGAATITVTAQDADGNRVSDTYDVGVVKAPDPQEQDPPEEPPSVANLRCIAETGRVAFLWKAPEWSGGELYAYDYQLTLPGGQSEGGRLMGSTSTLLYRPRDYPSGGETSVSVTAVYELLDGKQVRSAEATLTCTVRG